MRIILNTDIGPQYVTYLTNSSSKYFAVALYLSVNYIPSSEDRLYIYTHIIIRPVATGGGGLRGLGPPEIG